MKTNFSGKGHRHGDCDHPRVSRPMVGSIREGVAVNKKFGFTMRYKRYNRKNVTDEVEEL